MLPTSSTTDSKLLRRVRTLPPDAEAWAQFVARYGPKLLAWCHRWGLGRIDAEEVTQIVLARLVVALRTFTYDSNGSFRAWLRTVTHHAWQDYVAAQRRAVQGTGDSQVRQALESVEAGEDLLERLDEEFERNQLEEAMERVRERVKQTSWDAFYRLTFLQQSGREVAQDLGMEVAAVYVAKKRVQTMLHEEVQKLSGARAE